MKQGYFLDQGEHLLFYDYSKFDQKFVCFNPVYLYADFYLVEFNISYCLTDQFFLRYNLNRKLGKTGNNLIKNKSIKKINQNKGRSNWSTQL